MMVNDHNHQPNIEAVRELLSPYLDGEVTAQERALVESALATSAELREDLATLRQTVALLAELSPVAAPRPFTLTAAHVRAAGPTSRRIWGVPAWLAGWAMVAASLLCVLAIGGALFTLQFQGAGAPAQIARLDEPAAQEAAAPQPESLATAGSSAVAGEAELSPAEPAEAPPEEKMMLAESAEEAAPSTESTAQPEDVVVEEAQELAADQTTEDMASIAGASDEATERQMQLESSAAESAPLDREAAGAAPAPAPSPLPTIAPESPAAQKAMPAEAPAEEPPGALAEEAPSVPPPAAPEEQPSEQNLAAPVEASPPAQEEIQVTAEPQPTAPATPTLAPTVGAQVTVTASPSPVPPSPTPATGPAQTSVGLSRSLLIFIAGLFVIGGLALLGLGIWLRRQKQQN